MRYVLVALALGALSACGNGDDGQSAGSCADLVTFAGVDYLGTGDEVGAAGVSVAGDELGPAEQPACDDGGSEDGVVFGGGTRTAYALVGLDQQWAIAFGSDRTDARIYIVDGPDIPAEVRARLRPAT